jgi:hypothetical protein
MDQLRDMDQLHDHTQAKTKTGDAGITESPALAIGLFFLYVPCPL